MENKVKYRIKEKQINGIEIEKFILETIDDGKRAAVSIDDTIKLARVGKLYNISSLLDVTTGRYILNFNNTLKDIQEYQAIKLTLICRIINSEDKCIGYKAKDDSNKSYKLSINKAWELAVNNSIVNVKGKIIKDKKAIVGINGFSLEQLPKMLE